LDLLQTTLYILRKNRSLGSDRLMEFCFYFDVMLFSCVLFLGKQTGPNGFFFFFFYALFCCVFILGLVVRLWRRKEIRKMLDLISLIVF
jgi:lipopolysaccharide export LptBFGC system permease protein LptF